MYGRYARCQWCGEFDYMYECNGCYVCNECFRKELFDEFDEDDLTRSFV